MLDEEVVRGAVERATPESEDERNERLFQALPPLDSPAYLTLLKTASARDLPAPVLVRAFRQLVGTRGGEATLGRLLTTDATYGYLRPLRRMAEKLVKPGSDWFDPTYLVEHAVSFIAEALAGPRGEGADRAWHRFLRHRLIDAYRDLNGRENGRRDPPRFEPRRDPNTGMRQDPLELVDSDDAPLNGNVGSDSEGWLWNFVQRTLPTVIADPVVLEVALDLFGKDPSPISGKGTPHKPAMTVRYGVDRYQIYRWRQVARVKLLRALEEQNEREIDVSWLREALLKPEDDDHTRRAGVPEPSPRRGTT
jgi:hypothetical protein